MASQGLIKKSVNETFEEFKKYSPADYKKILSDPAWKETITDVAKSAAAEEIDFDRMFLQNPGEEVVSLLTETLPPERIQLVQQALFIPTFDMKIIQQDERRGLNYLASVEFWSEGDEFLPSMVIQSLDEINKAKIWQYASIVIESVMLAMQAAGIKVAVSKGTMKGAVKNAAKEIEKSSAMQKAMQTFLRSWRRAGSNNWAKARAIFFLLKDSSAAGLFWTIVSSLCKEMSWWDWTKTSAQVSGLPNE